MSKWQSFEAKTLRRYAHRYLYPAVVDPQKISRLNSFCDSFLTFAKRLCEAHSRVFHPVECLSDNDLCGLFIKHVCRENRDKTRPASALRSLNAKRATIGVPALPVGGDISDIIKAAKRNSPKMVKKSSGIDVVYVKRIVKHFTFSGVWFQRMVALMTALGFLCLLRLGEVRSILIVGVVFVHHDFQQNVAAPTALSDRSFLLSVPLPNVAVVRAVQLYLTFRKTSQTQGSFITCSDPNVIMLLHRHVTFLRSIAYTGKFLFPSRMRAGGRWTPHPSNPMSRSSYVLLIRLALFKVCGLPWDVCQGYTGHLLRVGGNNFVRQSKSLSEDINRQIGDWASLASCRSYNQLSVAEQLLYTDRLRL